MHQAAYCKYTAIVSPCSGMVFIRCKLIKQNHVITQEHSGLIRTGTETHILRRVRHRHALAVKGAAVFSVWTGPTCLALERRNCPHTDLLLNQGCSSYCCYHYCQRKKRTELNWQTLPTDALGPPDDSFPRW